MNFEPTNRDKQFFGATTLCTPTVRQRRRARTQDLNTTEDYDPNAQYAEDQIDRTIPEDEALETEPEAECESDEDCDEGCECSEEGECECEDAAPSSVAEATARYIASTLATNDFDPDQPRDESGKWSGGGGATGGAKTTGGGGPHFNAEHDTSHAAGKQEHVTRLHELTAAETRVVSQSPEHKIEHNRATGEYTGYTKLGGRWSKAGTATSHASATKITAGALRTQSQFEKVPRIATALSARAEQLAPKVSVGPRGRYGIGGPRGIRTSISPRGKL